MTIAVRAARRYFDDNQLLGNVDSPKPGSQPDLPCVEVLGWALHRQHTFSEVRIRGKYFDTRAMSYPRPDVAALYGSEMKQAAWCGFHLIVWACDIADDPLIQVYGLTEDGVEILLADLEIDAPQPELSSPGDPGVLLVSNVGRSGSSVLMGMLLKHPEIAGAKSPSYELHFVLGEVHRLKLAIQYTFPMVYYYRPWFDDDIRGMELYGITRSEQAQVQPFLIGKEVEHFRDLVRSYFNEILGAGGSKHRYVCEKATQPAQRSLARFLSWYWHEFREIVLARDPRDLICSYVAFDKARGVEGYGFSKGLDKDPEAFFRDVGKSYDELRQRVIHSGEKVLIVRYEDLIRGPFDTMLDVFAWLDVDTSDEIIHQVLDTSDLRFEMGARHMTSSDAVASIGRWRKDLPAEYIDLVAKYISKSGEFFGYK